MDYQYGFCITEKGYDLIAKLVAGKKLQISRVMVGSGGVEVGADPRQMTGLAEPVALATSTEPNYDGHAVTMTVQYRNNLNGGLDRDFDLREFGVFAYDPDLGEILLYYGCRGNAPIPVSAYNGKGVESYNFPVTILIGSDSGADVDYSCEAWMTSEDTEEYCTITILPLFLEEAQALVDAHNVSEDAHLDIRADITDLEARLALLELLWNTSVTGNPFTVTFGTLDGIEVTGAWNQPSKRIEY